MSWQACEEPQNKGLECPKVDMVITPRTADIGGFEVHRALPFRKRRLVGPFIFWDQMGPGEFMAGQGVDVRPHPHIGLSTVTYLFEGNLDHRDSLGTHMRIAPGDVNLMTAGRGIVHSERTGMDVRQVPTSLYGIQSWIAQPKTAEDGEPAFIHANKNDLPAFSDKGISGRVILGEFQGLRSPVFTQWETLYAEVRLDVQAKLSLPREIEERALYILDGELQIAGNQFTAGQMVILRPGAEIDVTATLITHFMLLGGATMDGPRHIYWNFVASDKARIEQAKEDWAAGRFAKVPGDEDEFIPLPDSGL